MLVVIETSSGDQENGHHQDGIYATNLFHNCNYVEYKAKIKTSVSFNLILTLNNPNRAGKYDLKLKFIFRKLCFSTIQLFFCDQKFVIHLVVQVGFIKIFDYRDFTGFYCKGQ